MNGPLEGVQVIELARNAPGAFCTMILGDLGADILRVDQAGADQRGCTLRAAKAGGILRYEPEQAKHCPQS